MSATGPHIEPTPLGPTLVETVRRLVGQAKAGDPLRRVTVVTPSFYSSFYLRRALAPGGLFNVDFARVDEIAEVLASDAIRERGSTALGRLQAAELVYAAAARSLGDETPLGRIRGHDATLKALHESFTQLSTLDDAALARFPTGRHFDDLRRAYLGYRAISSPFHDRHTVARFAAAALKRNDHPAIERFGTLVVLLVEAPPPQYRPIWNALVRLPAALVVVGLTGDSEADGLVTGLLEYPPTHPTAGGLPLATLVSAPNRTDEIKLVVRAVAGAARGGARLNRIAVLYADNSYGARLNDAFELAGINVCGPDPSLMAQTPHGRFLDGLFRIVEDGFSRDAAMNWLTSAPVRNPESGSETPSARWDAISRSAGITAGESSWERRLLDYATASEPGTGFKEDDEPSAAESRARRARAGHARQLARFMGQLATDLLRPISTWEQAADWLRGMIAGYLEPPGDEQGKQRREWIDELIDRIDSLEDLQGTSTPTFERLATIVRSELDRPLRSSRSLGTGVCVGSLTEAVGCVFDTVHVVGMREGLFPPPDRADPLLPDDARELLDPDGFVLPGRKVRRAIQRRRFLAAMGVASSVVLYWPRSERGALRESAPAPWFVEQARRHPNSEQIQAGELLKGRGESVTRMESDAIASGMPDSAGDLAEYDVALALLWRLGGHSAQRFPLITADGSAIGQALALLQDRGSTSWSRFDGNLSGATGGFAAPVGPVSATRFEKYAACPFRYFLGELAGVEPTEKPEDQLTLTALARGTLVHRILEQFVKDRGKGSERSLEKQRELLGDVARLEFRQFEKESTTGHPALWALEQRRILRNVARWLDVESRHMASTEWGTHHVEKEFGTGKPGALSPVRVELDDGRVVEFRGVMDRVDISRDESLATVFDYKTGSAAGYSGLEKDPVLRGTKLQLAVYSAAVRRAFPSAGEIRSSYWFVFEDPGKQLIPADGRFDHAEGASRLREVVEVVSDGISRGAFPARPGLAAYSAAGGSFKNCSYCEYDRVCPTQRQRQWTRKRGHAALENYVRLTGDLEEDE